ncbi:MAG TPA: hypothetical protein VK698_09190 [Kofleriaceae bacterium]|nr:hypothetical protein [Kofleriaceae bacterium]
MRCHLVRPTVAVRSWRLADGWRFAFWLPDLSDHVHRARVWRGPDGTVAVEIESEN